MKTILAIAFTALSLTAAQAIQYVTLNENNATVQVQPGDLVEVVGFAPLRNSSGPIIIFQYENGVRREANIGPISDLSGQKESFAAMKSMKFTGLNQISTRGWRRPNQGIAPITDLVWGVITLKITSASEINAVTPSSVLVLPENSTGDFDVIIESSSDLVSWLPFLSQTVNSQTARRFFRTRVVRTSVQPPLRPVEPNGGDSDR